MKKNLLAIAVVGALAVTSCNQQPKQKKTEQPKTETTEQEATETVNQTLTDSQGNSLEMSFDNAKDVVTLKFAGETVELPSQKPASGIWYKNDQYELQGKGLNIELKKDGKVVFAHKSEEPIVNDYTSADGKTLTVNVYNDTEKATLVYEGETIDLVSQRPASGIWYKNDHYELSGKGSDIELKKDGKIIFKSK